MIKAGNTVVVPWGIDDMEVVVVEVYTSGGIERAVVEDRSDECGTCGRGEAHAFVVPMTLVQLLPAKPIGLWFRGKR